MAGDDVYAVLRKLARASECARALLAMNGAIEPDEETVATVQMALAESLQEASVLIANGPSPLERSAPDMLRLLREIYLAADTAITKGSVVPFNLGCALGWIIGKSISGIERATGVLLPMAVDEQRHAVIALGASDGTGPG